MNRISKGSNGWALIPTLLALACGGHVNLGDDPVNTGGDGQSTGAGASNGGGTNDATEGTPSGATAGGSADPDLAATCPATCQDPAGSVEPLATADAFYASFVGKWRICSGAASVFGGIPDDVIGVEYAAPTPVDLPNEGPYLRGAMYYLVDSKDGPVRGTGFAYQLTYDVSPQNPDEGPPSQLNMHPTPNSGFGGSFLYSPCPREWQLSGGSAQPDGKAILVPVD